ncbi:fas-associated death domain protein [Anoplophora glabripennis]|uniref:Death domain-containing adapter protein BG4 n=1 Tax=Anoplophora glabripennis TaxID=217634 RepID=V5I957_ANOGL|nr:fas-associated death domain protein [Anoplophora glabripennis]
MTKEEKYSHLRNTLIGISCRDNELNILKQHFRNEIFSDRRYDRIHNLMNLIKILEKRDVISPNDISSLGYIANVLQNNDIIELINHFNVPTQAEPVRQNVAAPVEPMNQNVGPANNIGRVLPVIDTDPTGRVYDLICREIGQKWKDFARALKIGEGYIDQLEYQHRSNIEEITRQVIIYHRQICDPPYWKYKLTQALDEARRKDLSMKVQEIFAMYSSL